MYQNGPETMITIADRPAVPFRLSPSQVPRAVRTFVSKVEKIRPQYLEPPPADGAAFVAGAGRASYECFVTASALPFDDVASVVRETIEYVRRAAMRRVAPLVEIVVADSQYLPWEWLTIPAPRPRRLPGDAAAGQLYEPVHDLAKVLGFAAIVRRRFRHDLPGGPARAVNGRLPARLVLRANAEARLPLKFVRHIDLDGAALQEGYFNFRRASIDLIGPLPRPADVDAFDLGEHLLDPLTGLEPRTDQDQVFHIHCHHDVGATDADDDQHTSRLVLQDEPVFEVTYMQLQEALADPTRRFSITAHRPLVFLNLCRGDFDPRSTQSISELLLRNGNRGVVSTSIKVPDQVAARFAGLFYEHLLFHPGSTAGEALQHAKVELARRHKNPLGLVYTYSGESGLFVAPSMTGCVEVPMPI